MDIQYKKVYIKDNYIPAEQINDEIKINVEYVYLTIPQEYVCIYHKLLVYLADFGENAIKDCKSSCESNNLYIIQCWNIFQSAIACHTLGLFDKANLFIKYIEAQLDLIYKGTDKEVYCRQSSVLPISEDGKLKARISCSNKNAKFFVNPETGKLYEKYIYDKTHNEVYTVENNHLKEIKNETSD